MKYIIAVDLGGTNLRIGLFNHKIKIKDKRILDTRRFIQKKNLIRAIIDSIREIIKKNRLSKEDILGAGLGFPGPIDYKKGIVHFLPNIPGWKGVHLRRILKKRLGIHIFIDNDANLMSLAEHRLGAAASYENAICLTLGTGVGGGVIINGRLFRGNAYSAGEIGHIPINEDGPLCNCGGKACLETYIGNRQILKRAKKLFKRKIDLEQLSRLAKKNDRRATIIWNEVGQRLAVALTGVVNLFNPDCIVVGGGISNAGRTLFASIKKTIRERAMPVQADYVKVLKAKLGPDAGIIGAAIMVKERGQMKPQLMEREAT